MPNDSPISWKRATALSSLVVYGPFVLMSLYTLLFVSCDHCKAAVWKLLFCAPGLLPMTAGRQALGLPRLPDGVEFLLAFLACLGMILLLSRLVRQGGGIRFGSLAVVGIISSLFAVGTLAMIRA